MQQNLLLDDTINAMKNFLKYYYMPEFWKITHMGMFSKLLFENWIQLYKNTGLTCCMIWWLDTKRHRLHGKLGIVGSNSTKNVKQ